MDEILIEIPASTEKAFTKTLRVTGGGLDLPDEELRFPSPGLVSVFVEPVGDGYAVTGKLRIDVEVACSRCLVPVRIDIEESFRYVLSRIHLHPSPEEDWVFWSHEEREFDLAPVVRELLLVSLPAKPLCDVACLGLCPVCRKNRNTGACRCSESERASHTRPPSALSSGLGSMDLRNNKEFVRDGGSKEKGLKDQKR